MKQTKINSGINSFPNVRLRRLRTTSAVRDLLQETRLSSKDLIAPILVQEGLKNTQEVPSMPDIWRIPLSKLVVEVDRILQLGISAIILFGLPLQKDANAKSAFNGDGIVQKSIQVLRKQFGSKVAIITDVCLCQYTSHGHCGLVVNRKIDNDKTIGALAKVAVSHARAGADIVAPSAMMDGQVQALRTALDSVGFADVAIMGYSAKQASPLYAPFRDAAYSTPEFGDRRTYQMPFSNAREAMREIETDIAEGVDIVMIKPAIPYLDLVYTARQTTYLPICAYSVSGEYALIKAAAMNGWIDENSVMTEFITSIKRAGANMIITYYAKKMAEILNS
ncbi:MAG TPA: porphobilinogen synthase [Nitrososphaera sp.]|jgi:porphobilinogen synthase|nr:porphobilinogen synthase [Nitrososphaera sp.]